MSCEYCTYFDYHNDHGAGGYGACLLNPPVQAGIINFESTAGYEDVDNWVHPIVFEDNFCKHFDLNRQKPEDLP